MAPDRPTRPVQIGASATTFRRRLRRKSAQDRDTILKALKQMVDDLNYPSLRVERITNKPGFWEARASGSLRISFTFIDDDHIRLRVNCSHDHVYGRSA